MRFTKVDEKDVPLNATIILDCLRAIRMFREWIEWDKKFREYIPDFPKPIQEKERWIKEKQAAIKEARDGINNGNRITWRQCEERAKRKEAQS